MIKTNKKADIKTAWYLDEDVFYQGVVVGKRYYPDSSDGGFGCVEISDDIINTELFFDIETAFHVCGELPIITGEKFVELYDHDIVHLNNLGKEKSIICKDKNGIVHKIDLVSCMTNYNEEHPESSGKCVGERDAWLGYFTFYTSGIKTKIVFKKKYVFNFDERYRLKGSRYNRFTQLREYISRCGYTTYDMS